MKRRATLVLALVTGAALAGCVSASAQQGDGGLLRALNLSTEVTEPKDFVKQSRPPDMPSGHISTQTPDRPRPTRVKTDEEIRATEAQLDAARARHDRIAGRKPPKDVGKSAAGPEKKKKKKIAGPHVILAPAAAN